MLATQSNTKLIENPYIVLIGNTNESSQNISNNITKMKELFSKKCGYKNISIAAEEINSESLDSDALNSYLNDRSALIQLNKKVDSLIIIYSGYGYFNESNNYILCNDNNKVSLKQITDKFISKSCDYLSNKPKILFLDYYNKQPTENTCNDDEKTPSKNKTNTSFNEFFIHSVLLKQNTNNSPFINAIYKHYNTNKLSLKQISNKINASIPENEIITLQINAQLPYKIHIKSTNIQTIDDEKSIDNNSWKSKNMTEWTCSELQTYVQTLEISDKKYEKELLSMIQKTNKTGNDMVQGNMDITDVPKASFSSYRNKANDMFSWLGTKMKLFTPTPQQTDIKSKKKKSQNTVDETVIYKDPNNIQDQYEHSQTPKQKQKQQQQTNVQQQQTNVQPQADENVIAAIDDEPWKINEQNNDNNNVNTWGNILIADWSCQQLQDWINSLDNIPKYVKKKIIKEIADAEATGDDFAACNCADDIIDSFNNISKSLGNKIYNALESVQVEQIGNIAIDGNEEDIEEMYNDEYVKEDKFGMYGKTWKDKGIDEWNVSELQGWIVSLSLDELNKQILVNGIGEQGLGGMDFNDVQSVDDIYDTFPELNRNAARLVYKQLQKIR